IAETVRSGARRSTPGQQADRFGPDRGRPGARDRSGLGGVLVVGIVFNRPENLLADQSGILPDCGFDARSHFRIVLQKCLGVFTALTDPLAVIGEPRAGLLHHPGLDAEIDELAHFRDALAIHDVEFDLLEGRRKLVFYNLVWRLIADQYFAIL